MFSVERLRFGWTRMDAICSLCIAFMIAYNVRFVLKGAAVILLQRTPMARKSKLRNSLLEVMALEGVQSYRNPHFWTLCDGQLVGTLHVQVHRDADKQRTLNMISNFFKESPMGITNLSVQIETEKFLSGLDPEKHSELHMNGLF